MPRPVTMPQGAIEAFERVYETPAGIHIKNKVTESTLGQQSDPAFKSLFITGKVCDETGAAVLDGDGHEVIAPPIGLSINLGAVANKSLAVVIKDEAQPTEIPTTNPKPLRQGVVWLKPSTGAAKVHFNASFHDLGTYDPAVEADLVKLQIDAVKEVFHLDCALKTENYALVLNHDWSA